MHQSYFSRGICQSVGAPIPVYVASLAGLPGSVKGFPRELLQVISSDIMIELEGIN